MTAQLLRLRLQLLGNLFRRQIWPAIGIGIGLLYGLALAGALFLLLASLRLFTDVGLLGDVFIVAGSIITLGFIVAPVAFGVDDALDPRRFALFGMPNRTLTLGLAVASLVGIPAVIFTIVLLGTVVTWSRGPLEIIVAVLAAAITLATCMLLTRIASSFASFALSTRRARDLTGVLGILLIVLLSPVILGLATTDWSRDGVRVLENLAGVLGWTPLGAMWGLASDAAAGAIGPLLLRLVVALATLGAAWLLWQALVARMLVTPGREAESKSYAGLGWFDRLPSGPMWAVTARALTYWTRDARYWVSVLIIPIAPILIVIPLAIAGIPVEYIALIPVPLMSIFLGWTLHNDVAYDSTAIWLHVSSGVRGIADRVGRLVPLFVVSIIAIAGGSVVSALVHGDWDIYPAIVGVSTCLLFAGFGVSSVMSARFPYPVVKPGDSPFQQPQSSGTLAAIVQSVTLVASLVLAAPAIAFAVLGLLQEDPQWYFASFLAGTGIGLVALIGGIAGGSAIYDRRGPEMLEAALRA